MASKISVVMACFNAAAHISRAIESVLSQGGVDLELIVVDDCSTDETVDLVARLAGSDPRVRLLRQQQNGGPSAARNAGFRSATGDWLAIIDADDAFAPGRLREMLTAAEERQLDFVFDQLVLYDAGARQETGLAPATIDQAHLDLRSLIRSERPGPVFRLGFLKPLIRRSFLESRDLRYREDVRLAEDFMLYAEALLKGARCELIATPGYVYTTQVGQSSGDRSAASHTIYDPRVRLGIAEALIVDYADASKEDMALLRLYRVWQLRYVAIFHMSMLQRKRRFAAFLAVALRNPKAATQFVLTSSTFKRMRAVANR
jgi:succinoglycan biosynthesis protein ExoO